MSATTELHRGEHGFLRIPRRGKRVKGSVPRRLNVSAPFDVETVAQSSVAVFDAHMANGQGFVRKNPFKKWEPISADEARNAIGDYFRTIVDNNRIDDVCRGITGVRVKASRGIPHLRPRSMVVSVLQEERYGDGPRYFTHGEGWGFIQKKGVHKVTSTLKVRQAR